MAMFKAPKVTTAQRNTLTLEVSELVYDVDQKAFYGGDGTTLGGFLVGETSGFIVEQVEFSQQDINNGLVTMLHAKRTLGRGHIIGLWSLLLERE